MPGGACPPSSRDPSQVISRVPARGSANRLRTRRPEQSTTNALTRRSEDSPRVAVVAVRNGFGDGWLRVNPSKRLGSTAITFGFQMSVGVVLDDALANGLRPSTSQMVRTRV